jgi:hypothetical protein
MATEIERRKVELERAAAFLQENVNAVRMVASDLHDALDLIKRYQAVIERLYAPDPNVGEANTLLKKYGVTPADRSKFFAVLVDGLDITDITELTEGSSIFDHPIFDAEGTATDAPEELEGDGPGLLPPGA